MSQTPHFSSPGPSRQLTSPLATYSGAHSSQAARLRRACSGSSGGAVSSDAVTSGVLQGRRQALGGAPSPGLADQRCQEGRVDAIQLDGDPAEPADVG